MKESDFLKQLNRELENAVPPLSDRLKNEPLAVDGENKERSVFVKSSGNEKAPKRKKRLLGGILASAAAAVLICAIAVGAFLAGNPLVPDARYACMYIDINPSLALTLDKNYRVKQAVSRNADGDTLLQDEAFAASLVGASAEEAAVMIADRAARTGYIKPDDAGSAKGFNQMSVSFLDTVGTPAETQDGVREELRRYFCASGMYVYVETFAKKDASAEQTVKELEARPVSWHDFAAAEADPDSLRALAEAIVYDYAADLLEDALGKYDLLEEIRAIEEEIEANSDNTGLLNSYWTIDENLNADIYRLCGEMKPKIEKLYLLYGVDCRARGLLQGTVSHQKYLAAVYAAIAAEDDVEALKRLRAQGIRAETFGGIENLPLRLQYYRLVANDVFARIAADILDGAAVTLEKLTEDVAALIADRADARFAKYSALFALPRAPVTENEYAAFLRRIGKA